MSIFGYEEVAHTADWALRVWAADLAGLLTAAAHGMLAFVEARPASEERRWRSLQLRAEDGEGLLVSWLEEILFLLETGGETCTAIELSVPREFELRGRVQLAPAVRPKKHIKAVTYHNLSIERTEGGLETVIVFDV